MMKNIKSTFPGKGILLSAVLLLAVFWSEPASCQTDSGGVYHALVLSKALNDTAFLYQFNLLKQVEDTKEILVLANQEYMPMLNSVNGYKMISITNRFAACDSLQSGQRKVILMLSPIKVIDTLDRFFISIMCYELEKKKNKCTWKIFAGGTLLNSQDYTYYFYYDKKVKRWQIE